MKNLKVFDKLRKVLLVLLCLTGLSGCLLPSEGRAAVSEELLMDIEYTEPADFGSFYSGTADLAPDITSSGDDLGYMLYMDSRTRIQLMSYLDSLTGNNEISWIIVKASIKYDIPMQLAFALAFTESSFNPEAVNLNKNSIDRGLFQLNNRSFPDLNEVDFFNPALNADYGISYLKKCLARAGNEVTALAMYNAGPTRVSDRGAPEKTLQYIDKIFDYSEEMESRFRTISLDPSMNFNFTSNKWTKSISLLRE